jgi:hypothetical protein
MSITFKSKEGRSILTSLVDRSSGAAELAPEAGRDFIGALGFRLVSIARQFLQSPNAYQHWLNQQRLRVTKEFIAICKRESKENEGRLEQLTHSAKTIEKYSELSGESLQMLKSSPSEHARPRVLTPNEFLKLLSPELHSIQKNQYSGLRKLINLLNPFDKESEANNDWLSQFRSSGQALRIEMFDLLENYYDLEQSRWDPVEEDSWISSGANLIHLNNAIARLCQSAREMLLVGDAREAGFSLGLIFNLLKGLSSEKVILTYLIAHPQSVLNAESWSDAISKARVL